MVDGWDEQWQADLVDVQRLASENNGYRYWLTAIDIVSRYAWIVPIKDKTGMDVVRAFQKIFREGRQPRALETDEGTEFLNHQFQGFLNSQNIRHFVVYSDPKAQIIERFHRTIKNRLWRYFYLRGNERYLEVLPELVRGHNAAYHRTIGRSPDSVPMENAQEVCVRRRDEDEIKFKVGDRVRISKVARVQEGVFAQLDRRGVRGGRAHEGVTQKERRNRMTSCLPISLTRLNEIIKASQDSWVHLCEDCNMLSTEVTKNQTCGV